MDDQAEEAQRQFLARAEQVLARHAETYRAEIPALIRKMAELAKNIETTDSAESLALLKRMAHDMKGQGAMFGLPDFATVATSLCLLLSKGNRAHSHYLAAVKLHIDTLQRLPSDSSGQIPAPAINLIAEAQQETQLVLKE